MLTGFVRHPDGSTETQTSVEEVARIPRGAGATLWIDLEAPGEGELRAVSEMFNINPEAQEDCLSGDQRPRVDEFADHLFLLFYGMLLDEEALEFGPGKLGAFCGADFLVTVHRDPLPSIRTVRERCERHLEQTLRRGVDFIFYSIIDGIVDRYAIVAERYEHKLDELEETSLEQARGGVVWETVSELRRKLLELRAVASSHRELLVPIAKGECDYISEALEQRFAHVRDHLTQVIETIDVQRELLHGVRDDYHSALADQMNETMKMLTLIATVLLPLSLIAGVYGMNLPLWPAPDQPWSFWTVVGGMFVVGLAMFGYFRWKRWV
jgi:magnesium transporter